MFEIFKITNSLTSKSLKILNELYLTYFNNIYKFLGFVCCSGQHPTGSSSSHQTQDEENVTTDHADREISDNADSRQLEEIVQ